MESEKSSFNIHSIYVKILALVVIAILAFALLNVGYIIPSAKKTIRTVNENNMKDLAALSGEIVELEMEAQGVENITYDVLKPLLDGKGLNGISSSYIYHQ